jgi:sulfur-carrier protein
MKILYFAWMRQRIGSSAETIDLPGDVNTVNDLVGWLVGRGENYGQAFTKREVIRAAVNQEYVRFDHPVSNDDEIAFFPPVTGG